MLASVVAWSVLTSVAPIIVGLLAISGFLLGSSGAETSVVNHLHAALQSTVPKQELQSLVGAVIRNRGVLTIIGIVGVLWGGSNVGGAISTVFQPVFQVGGRNFFKEKLIDVVMIFVFAALMIVIVASTSAISLVEGLFSGLNLPGIVFFVAGTAVSLLAAFILFSLIYLVFPNTKPRFRFNHIWSGAGISAVLFQLLTYIFPLYSHFSHFQRYGAVLFPILLLTAWIYFFAMILMIGSEFVAYYSLKQAKAQNSKIGPPQGAFVPQRGGPDPEVYEDTGS